MSYVNRVAASACLAVVVFATGPLLAQSADAEEDLSEVVITGSSLRGVPPVGSNLIEIGREDVLASGATTVQDLLSNVPQFATFNRNPQPAFGSAGNISTGPSLRGIGIAQTLSLLNGHRLVGTGHLQNNPDPSIVPPSAVERVEIVADGASAIYGSDAIAGVVNVITRKNYSGAETTIRYGDNAYGNNLNASQLFGRAWGTGSFLVTAEYTSSDRLNASDFDIFNSDRTSVGGSDGRVLTCAAPTVRPAGTTTDYSYPTFALGANRCDNAKRADVVPQQDRTSAFATGRQEFGESVEAYVDLTWSKNKTNYFTTTGAPAAFNITNANPFFIAPPGTGATAERITMDLTTIVGSPTWKHHEGIEVYGATVGAGIKLPRDFKLDVYGSVGYSSSFILSPSGNPAVITSAAAGTTPATALDPFQGRTSPAIVAALLDWNSSFGSIQKLQEISAKVDGPLFGLPGGEVKVALGAEYRRETYDGYQYTGPNSTTVGGSLGLAGAVRKVASVFAEVFVPVIGDDNALPLVRSLDLSVSGRYDDYSDFGDTTNPKYGFTWSPFESVKLRGSYGTSYHAPALPDLSGPDSRAQFAASFPAQPAGQGPADTFILAGSNPNLLPETAITRSLGLDFVPANLLPGFRASATYYTIDFEGLIDFPRGNIFIDPYYAQFGFANLTPAQVLVLIAGQRVVGANPPFTATTVVDLRRKNLGVVSTDGLDLDFNYRWTTSFGHLQASLGGNKVFNYDQQASPVSAAVDQFQRGLTDQNYRASLAAVAGAIRGNIGVNYSGSYQQTYATPAGATLLETVDSFTTVELHLGYDLGAGKSGWLEGTELMFDVENALDQDPPSTLSPAAGLGLAGGGGVGAGNPFGRVITVGITKKW